MIDKQTTLPYAAKAGLFLVGICALIAILYIGQSIIVPLIFSFIFAILLNPVVNLFLRLKVNRILAIGITLILTFILIVGFASFIFSQVSQFGESWPILVDKFTVLLNDTITGAARYFDIKPQYIHEWISKAQADLINLNGAVIGQTLVSVGSGLAVLFLFPVYIFVILYYKPLLLEFIRRLFVNNHGSEAAEIVKETKNVVQHYLVGLLIEAVIVAVLNSVGLLLLGIEYAILLGVVGALLNVIPYIGGIIAISLPIMVALVTKTTAWYAVYVVILYIVIQMIDNNYIVPKIVASKVKINALFSIIVVLVGNMLWGVSGMFLSIPLLAIVKVIFDHIDSLKPWGFLLGDTMPPLMKIKPLFRKKKIKKV